jgi:hypothetical protein
MRKGLLACGAIFGLLLALWIVAGAVSLPGPRFRGITRTVSIKMPCAEYALQKRSRLCTETHPRLRQSVIACFVRTSRFSPHCMLRRNSRAW